MSDRARSRLSTPAYLTAAPLPGTAVDLAGGIRHPESDLIGLWRDYLAAVTDLAQATGEMDEAKAAPRRAGGEEAGAFPTLAELEARHDRLTERCAEIEDEVIRRRAATLEGFRIKAAVARMAAGDAEPQILSSELALAWSIVDDLLALHSTDS